MDIQNVIAMLQSIGLTQEQIAAEIGCSQANISARKKRSRRSSNQLVTGLNKLLIKYGLNDKVTK